MSGSGATMLVARREAALLVRGRTAGALVAVLGAVAWIPVLLTPLRSGTLGIATFGEATPLLLALAGVVLPLLALLAGTDLLAGEIEDGTLVPVLTLPISRRTCFIGKGLARAALLATAYTTAFGSAGAAVALAHGAAGGVDFVAVAAAGLLLCLVCGGLGAWLGAAGAGRVRAYGAALASWVVLAFVLDAILLALVVAMTAPPPRVGMHGHGELSVMEKTPPAADPHAHAGGDVGTGPSTPV
ncbi:MAG: ABC transporter permease subunit, partial [Acidobacteriota bacterium]